MIELKAKQQINLNLIAAGSSSPTLALAGAPLGAGALLEPEPPSVHNLFKIETKESMKIEL